MLRGIATSSVISNSGWQQVAYRSERLPLQRSLRQEHVLQSAPLEVVTVEKVEASRHRSRQRLRLGE
jgi:hypothetical protein